MSAFLSELEFAIRHLTPNVPDDIREEIQTKFEALKELGGKFDNAAVADTMVAIGKLEWPYRHAFEAMYNRCCTMKKHEMMLEALSPTTRKKFLAIGGAEVPLKELMRSNLFEEKFTPEQRYEIQEASLGAHLKIADYMGDQIKGRPEEHEEELQKAFKEQEKIAAAIDRLQALVGVDEHWGLEIAGKVEQMKLGWSIGEPDVTLNDVEKEIEYWQGILSAGA